MLEKIVKYIGYAVLILAAVMSIAYFVGNSQAPGLEQQAEEAKNLDSIQKQEAVAEIADNWNAGVLNVAIIILVVSGGLIVIFAIGKFIETLISEPKKAIKSIVSIGVIAIVVVLAYILASDAIPNFMGAEKFNVTPSMSRWVDTGLWVAYLFFAFAFVGIVYTEVSKIWR